MPFSFCKTIFAWHYVMLHSFMADYYLSVQSSCTVQFSELNDEETKKGLVLVTGAWLAAFVYINI